MKEYTELEERAIKWIKETDTSQYQLFELLTMFHDSENQLTKEPNKQKCQQTQSP